MGNCCLVAWSSGVRGDEILRAGDGKDPKCIYRDDLNEKLLPSKEGGGRVAGTTLHERGGRSKVVGSWEGVTRVKILLTKQEAALLLSNCKLEEGLLKCKLSQLQKIGITFSPPATVIFPNSPDHDSWKPALESVSEEL